MVDKLFGCGLYSLSRLRLPAILLLAVLLLASAAPAGETPADKLDIIRRILSERGEYDLAEGELKRFVGEQQGRPIAAEALLLLGYCQEKQKKNQEAAASYSRIMTEHPDAPAPLKADASLGAGDAWFRLGRYDEAVRYYTSVLELTAKPDQGEAALLWRAEANYRGAMEDVDRGRDASKRLSAAIADFASFMERYPQSKSLPSAVYSAAFACFDSDDYARALQFFARFNKEFTDDRRYEECRFYAAESLYRLKRYDEAKIAYEAVVADFPAGRFAADARGGAAWSDYGLRRIREAAAGFEEAAKLSADNREKALAYLYDAGCAWREAGDSRKAAEPLLEVAKASDHELNGLAWFRLGTLWQEQAKEARDRADAAASTAERDRYRAMQKKMGEDATQYFRRALASGKLGGEEVEAKSLLGEVLLDAERYEEAAKEFKDIALRWPQSDRAPWALYHEALAERELSAAAKNEAATKEHLSLAAAALKKSLDYPAAKTRLLAVWALAGYLNTLGDTDGARQQYRWLASDGQTWAANWRTRDGGSDASLVALAKNYAADSLFNLGESYYFAVDYPRAASLYQEILDKHADTPQAAMAMFRTGEISEFGKDNAVAMSRYEEAVKLGVKFGKARVGTTLGYAHLRLGTLQLREGQREKDEAKRRKLLQEALKNLSAVIADPPDGLNLGRPYYYLAEAKYSLGLKKESQADYESSLKADGEGDLADAALFGLAWVKRDLGDSEGAITACKNLIDRFPASQVRPDAMALMASLKRAAKDPAAALVDFDAFLAEYSGHQLAARVELERASALDELGRHEESAAAFQKFLAAHPDSPDVPQALYQRSWALWNQIKPKVAEVRDAEADLRRVSGGREVESLPEADRAEAYAVRDRLRGLTAQVKSVEDSILSSLRELTERYPDYAVADAAWLRIGEILYDRGDYQQALTAYQKALTLAEAKKSDLGDKAQYRLAWSIQRLAEASERAWQTEANPERRDALRKEMWDRRIAAIDAFELILGKYPKSDLVGDACFRAAELRRRSGQEQSDPARRRAWFDTAAQRYAQALQKGGADAPYRRAAEYGTGISYLSIDKNAEAREEFRKMLMNYTDGPYVQEAYWGLGQSNFNLGAYADAASAFEQALTMDKATETAAKSRYGLGLTAAMTGNREQARVEFLAVDALYSNYPEWAAAALVRAARTALEDGQKDKAIGDLERVLARYSGTAAAEQARELQARISAGG